MRMKEKIGMLAAWGMLLLTVELLAHASPYSNERAERNSQIVRDYWSLTDSIAKLLSKERDCTASLKGASIGEPIDIRDPADSSKILAAVGDYHEIGYTITKLELRNVAGDATRKHGDLYIEIKKEMASAWGAPVFIRKITGITFESDQDKIQRCLLIEG